MTDDDAGHVSREPIRFRPYRRRLVMIPQVQDTPHNQFKIGSRMNQKERALENYVGPFPQGEWLNHRMVSGVKERLQQPPSWRSWCQWSRWRVRQTVA